LQAFGVEGGIAGAFFVGDHREAFARGRGKSTRNCFHRQKLETPDGFSLVPKLELGNEEKKRFSMRVAFVSLRELPDSQSPMNHAPDSPKT